MHIPVLLKEVMDFVIQEDLHESIYIDATFGAGGYTKEVLKRTKNAKVIGIDRDISVQGYADNLIQEFGNRFIFVNDKFSNIGNILNNHKIEKIAGIFYDFGISSMQIDQPERGFSFLKNGPLKMEMGLCEKDAFAVVNFYPETELANIIYNYSDEKYSRKIAKAICEYRKIKAIETTEELSEIVKKSVRYDPRAKIHPATRTFQAIRIFVNEELKEINISLNDVVNYLSKNARIACVSFHYLEDKIVKEVFSKYQGKRQKLNKYKSSEEEFNDSRMLTIIIKKPIQPSLDELKTNIRARSAILRVAQKL